MVNADILQQAVEASRDGIIISEIGDRDNPIIYANPAFEKLTGYERVEILGRDCRFLQGSDRDQPVLGEVRKALREGESCLVTLRNYRKDGSLFWNELSISPVHDDKGKLIYFVGVQKDISKRMAAETQLNKTREELERAYQMLEKESIVDPVTGIYNRRFFEKNGIQEWNRALREGRELSVFVIDIDYFKGYNDYYGHAEGDTCLQRVAGEMKETFSRATDVIVRHGGDEFIVLATGLDAEASMERANALCQKIAAIGIPHEASQVRKHVTVSIGVSTLKPDSSNSLPQVIQAADKALYAAKAKGRNRAAQELANS
jgi:diguanylate cyclase (GGDEF)-like protein/PAS domain S-box-containing protein